MKEVVKVKLNVKEYRTPKQFITMEELENLAKLFPTMTIEKLIELLKGEF